MVIFLCVLSSNLPQLCVVVHLLNLQRLIVGQFYHGTVNKCYFAATVEFN